MLQLAQELKARLVKLVLPVSVFLSIGPFYDGTGNG